MKNQRFFGCGAALWVIIASECGLTRSQMGAETDQSALIKVSVAMQASIVPLGQDPVAVVKVVNLSNNNNIGFTNRNYNFRVHVTGKSGEPPKTEYHRHLLGDFRSGDGPVLTDNGTPQLQTPPGKAYSLGIRLNRYYDLSVPGKYSAYVEIKDNSGVWLRTNTVQFDVTRENR